MPLKPLPKYVTHRMTSSEQSKWKTLLDKHKQASDHMISIQQRFTQAVRKSKLSPKALQTLANAGFLAEKRVLNVMDALDTYRSNLQKKYTRE